MRTEFVHLHVHSHYSLLDAMNRIDLLTAETKKLGMRAIALTDHGNMFGAIEFYQAAYRSGVKPIIGCEVYVAPGSRRDKSPRPDRCERGYHLTLLAASADGYRNLVKLSSLGYTEGFYYHPRVDDELLDAHSEGLIVLSGCLSGEAARKYLSGNEDAAAAALRKYRDIFGKDNFFIELQDHGLDAQREFLTFLQARSAADGIPTVATNDVHYLAPGDAKFHDALLCIGTRSLVRDTDRKRYGSDHGAGQSGQFYLKSPDEMKHRFAFDLGAISRTVEIAERVSLDLDFKKHHLPSFPIPIGEGDEPEFLRKLSGEGLLARVDAGAASYRDYQERLDYELGVIISKGFAGYFLIVADFISEAKRRRIPVGPGRGSAAGSLTAWCLGITEIDPIRYGLIFERFLNPERASLPDIDVDICQSCRDEVIAYVKQRYGDDRVAQIITFGTFGARAVLRDTARIYDLGGAETERLIRAIPEPVKMPLSEAIEKIAELKQAAAGPHAELLATAVKLEGLARHASRHAAGIVISNVPMTAVVPLYKDADGHIITQYDMKSVEALGLLKIDMLGLKTLTVIAEARTAAGLAPPPAGDQGPEPRGRDPGGGTQGAGPSRFPLPASRFDDPKVYELLSSGCALGVFQLDSAGIRELLVKIKPTSFEDLAALIALYRPGPMSLADEFASRKHGKTKISFLHPSLEPILKETYGIILYQEQVMEIAHRLGGYSLAKADTLRKAMGKKNQAMMSDEKESFKAGAVANGIDEDIATELFLQMERFAGYGFNKSHAIAYAAIAYETAWLKAHHPAEFMAALLSHELENRDKLAIYIAECRRMDLSVKPPHVNESGVFFFGNPEHREIVFGMACIKNVGIGACETIVEERKNGTFSSLWNFLQRIDSRRVNRRAIEALIITGALDGLGPNRRSMFEALPKLFDRAQAGHRDDDSDQMSLFSSDGSPPPEPRIEPLDEYADVAARELEFAGFYLGEPPLLKLFPAARFIKSETRWLFGVLRNVQSSNDKRGQKMARASLETVEETKELVIFASIYEKKSSLIEEGSLVAVTGKPDAGRVRDTSSEEPSRSGGKILVEDIAVLSEISWLARVVFPEETSTEKLQAIEEMLEKVRPGSCRVQIEFSRDGKRFRIQSQFLIMPDELISLESCSANITLEPEAPTQNRK